MIKMMHFAESTIEQATVDWLKELGYAFGPDIAFDGAAAFRRVK